jgi:hypothetical protein
VASDFDAKVNLRLFPKGAVSDGDMPMALELYKLMVASSEALVARRQGANTFFLTANGAVLTAIGLLLGRGLVSFLEGIGLVVLTATGLILSLVWRSLILSLGQLNTGKFAVINRLEGAFPVAIYGAEWVALGEGKDKTLYKSSTSREVRIPITFATIYSIAVLVELGAIAGIFPLK